MRVLFLTNIPSPYRVDFFNELGKNCDLTVTFEGLRATDRDEKWKSESAKHFTPVYLKGIRVNSDSFFCLGIIKIIKDNWDKIIIGVYSTPTSMLAIEYLKKKKIPFYIEADGGLIHQDSRIKYQIKRHFISAATGWFSSGEATTDYLVHYGADREKCYWYPFSSLKKQDLDNAVSIYLRDRKIPRDITGEKEDTIEGVLHEHLRIIEEVISQRRESAKRQLDIKERKMVLFVGQFIHRKGIDLIIEVAAQLDPDIGIYLVGGTPSEELQQDADKQNGAKIHFISFKTREELEVYYKAADLLLLPTREDIWGLVVNEAMAFGLPVVTTTKCVAGITLLTEEQIAESENVIDISNKVKFILNCSDNHFSLENLIRISPYTIENMAEQHIRILKNGDRG